MAAPTRISPRMGDRYTTSPGSVFGGAREARNQYHDFSTTAVWPWDGTPPSPVGTELCYGRLGGGLRDGVAVPPRHWHPTAMPPALNRATQAPRPRSARAPLDLVESGGWLPPPYSNLSHQRATLKPSALGESGWASRVARAPQTRTKPLGRRVRHFGARHRISCYRVRCWRGGCAVLGLTARYAAS